VFRAVLCGQAAGVVGVTAGHAPYNMLCGETGTLHPDRQPCWGFRYRTFTFECMPQHEYLRCLPELQHVKSCAISHSEA
jgi:hypothetical protein